MRDVKALPSPDDPIIEEVNCLVIDEWDSKSIATESDEVVRYHGYGNAKHILQENIYDREHWHRFLLRLGSRLVLSEFPDIVDPAAFSRWEVMSDTKLRVELDAVIPIPLGLRKVWYLLQEEVRRFKFKGLLIPVTNVAIPHRERWRNRTLEPSKVVSERVYNYLSDVVGHNRAYDTIDTKYQMSYFFPLIRGRVTISFYSTNIRSLPIQHIEKSNRRMYDKWYWEMLKDAERFEPDRRHGATSAIRIRYQHNPNRWKKIWQGDKESWRSILFYIMSAIKRNGQLPEPPGGFGESTLRC
jgi:hypothetical protein